MIPAVVSGLFEIGTKLIDKLIPDPEAKARAQLELLRQQQAGELQELQTRMSAILAEAQSSDPYTSRARPSMLYVFYTLIIAGLPMGLLAAISPSTAADVATGFGAWLSAIPENITDMATFVMLGYIGGRSFEKVKGAA
jgi:hypothetical protein